MTTAPILIFGAGKTGRGFAAHVCARAGRPFALIDRDQALIERLRAAGSFTVEVLGGAGTARLTPAFVAHLDDDAWLAPFAATELCFSAVFGTNLAALGARLGVALARRGSAAPLDIITLENLANAARVLREASLAAVPGAARAAIAARTGFVEGIVLKTCLAPTGALAAADPLRVLAQDLFRIPCDGEAFVGAPRALPDLDPLANFGHQLIRKIFTYNSINGVVSFIGVQRGHRELSAATNDPQILPLAWQAGDEASRGLIGEYGFAASEQREWVAAAIAKFRDPGIPDPLERNAADPERKLARDDRLVGPALLALKHGGEPRALARGIFAAAHYRDGTKPSPIERLGSLDRVLAEVCGLPTGHPLARLVRSVAQESDGAGG